MTRQIRVVPAILTSEPGALETMVRQAETFTNYVQVDIMDGLFVPSRSITWQHLAALPINLQWEVHLMVEQPQQHLEDYRKASAYKAVFHYEATDTPLEVIATTRELGLKVGLAINPETTVSQIKGLIGKVDSILLLTVNPGFYGSPFLPDVLEKVGQLRQLQPEIEVGVDGGIKEDNITRVAETGVDTICVGSAIFLQPHPGESYSRLLALAEGSNLP